MIQRYGTAGLNFRDLSYTTWKYSKKIGFAETNISDKTIIRVINVTLKSQTYYNLYSKIIHYDNDKTYNLRL